MLPASSFPHSAFRVRRSALTLVELLIVMVVIAILVSAILVGGSAMIHRGRDNNTAAVLQVVSQAVEEFKRDETARPKISGVTQPKNGGGTVKYLDRYDRYPPDELEVFTIQGLIGGIPGTAQDPRSLAPGRATVATNPPSPLPWAPMRFYNAGDGSEVLEHRDQLAMIVAIETLSESAAAILDRLPDKSRGTSQVFLDRPGGATGSLDAGDLELRPILDDWGNPISYLAERDFGLPGITPIDSLNQTGWNEASTELIRLNGGAPVVFSYGANGKDQLTRDAMEPDAKASLIGDFEDDSRPESHHRIDNPLNDDNIYADPKLREKLVKGLQQ